MTPILHSLLETDLYKFTMWQTMLHRHPQAQAEYRFVCRNTPAFPLAELLAEVERAARPPVRAVVHRGRARPTSARCATSRTTSSTSCASSSSSAASCRRRSRADGQTLEIVADGPQVHVMALRDLRAGDRQRAVLPPHRPGRRAGRGPHAAAGQDRRAARVRRERAGARAPVRVLRLRRAPPLLRRVAGGGRAHAEGRGARVLQGHVQRATSRRKFGLVAIGTMAHEYLQSYQAFDVRLRDFQKMALENWVQEYRGDLGVALTDVVGMDAFLADFDLYFAKLFDGLRHDSGDPVAWGEKALAHYAKLRIDAHTKRLTFSDGLDLTTSFAHLPPLRRPHAAGLRHRHQPHQRRRPGAAQHRDEADAVQRPAGGQAVGLAGQDAVQRRDLPRLPAPGVPHASPEAA